MDTESAGGKDVGAGQLVLPMSAWPKGSWQDEQETRLADLDYTARRVAEMQAVRARKAGHLCGECGAPILAVRGADDGYVHIGTGPAADSADAPNGWDHVARY